MAMTTCKECGGKVSTKAESCPHCGAVLKKQKKQRSPGCGMVLVLLIMFGVLFVVYVGTQGPSVDPTFGMQVPDKSPEKQAERRALIEGLIREGVWLKVEQPATLPHAYTGHAWDSLNVDDKSSFASATLAYYFAHDPRASMLIIYDGRTGKKLGDFSGLGLELD